jgi:hypothetical protein
MASANRRLGGGEAIPSLTLLLTPGSLFSYCRECWMGVTSHWPSWLISFAS